MTNGTNIFNIDNPSLIIAPTNAYKQITATTTNPANNNISYELINLPP